jgi:hypothetical protein
MFGRVGDAIADWAAGFVFNPAVWVGVVMGVVAIFLFVISFKLPDGSREPKAERRAAESGRAKQSVPRGGRRSSANDGGLGDTLGDDLDDIQAILRKHGIS